MATPYAHLLLYPTVVLVGYVSCLWASQASLGVPLVALIYGSSRSFDGVFWALIGCAATLWRSASPCRGPGAQ